MQTEDMKGFLKKLKTSRLGRLFGNTNMRWFECLFKERVFGYKDKMTDLKLRSAIKFEEITDFSDRLSLEDSKMCDWNYGFQLITRNRIFILYCQNKESLEKWTTAFNIILKRGPKKLAVIQTPNFNSLKPKQEQAKKFVDEKPKKEESKINQSEKEFKAIVPKNDIEIKREEIRKIEKRAPENIARKASEMIIVEDEEEINVKEEDYNVEQPRNLKREEYKAVKPKHTKNYIPQLIVEKPNLKTAVLKDEYDDNIENLIIEADKSFDKVAINNNNVNDKFYRHTKKNVRSSSAIVQENDSKTNNILKKIIQKEKEKKTTNVLVVEQIDDWNYYDKEGKRIIIDENAYNPATVNEGSKQTREEKRKKKEIANLLLGGVHVGVDSEEEQTITTNNGKSILKDNNKSYLNKVNNLNQNVNKPVADNNSKSFYDEYIENKLVTAEIKTKEETTKDTFIPKSILSNNTVLYDNNRKPRENNNSNTGSYLQDKFIIEGLPHPEIKRKSIVIEQHEEDYNEEISKFFDENKQNIQESKYHNQVKQKRTAEIKALKKLKDDFEDFDYHNQKQTINLTNRVVLNKPISNNSILQAANNKDEKNQINPQMNNSNIIGNLGAFDSNPELTNNILGNNDLLEKNQNVLNFQVKTKVKNNMNSSFVEDLTDDWEEIENNKK